MSKIIRISDISAAPARTGRREFLKGAAAAAAFAVGAGSIRRAGAAPAQQGGKKVTVVTGSPHKRGASFLLADEFIRGAREAGAEVFRFDAAFKRVTACSGCDHCGRLALRLPRRHVRAQSAFD